MEVERINTILSAERESIEFPRKKSFYVGKYRDAFFKRPWHYHPEYEILLITKGYGTRMVGDHFEPFAAGDLVLIGGYLPHAWISDPHFLQENTKAFCESVFIQFRKSIFGTQFIDAPELQSIRTVLAKAERGIKIKGHKYEWIKQQMLTLNKLAPLDQLLTLIKILEQIQHTGFEILASANYRQGGIFKSAKMTQAHNYIMQHFKDDVNVNRCATEIGMTTSSFCRFFKKHTHVTFSVYLNYLRINLAQKLLRNTQMPIKEIGFECGYLSTVYFNQRFKKTTGMSPKEYRNK